MKICGKCKTEKPIKEFYKDSSKKGYRWICKVCDKARIIEIQHAYKRRCIEYKGGKCTICGYSKYIGALDFHHTDPLEKDFSLSKARLRIERWEEIQRELDKCVLLCATHHREAHAGLITF